ncbi:MAG: hypothetical protein NC324_03140 [Bacteroides sp.]|nr:hypothetical protein [Bacteroides sp.]
MEIKTQEDLEKAMVKVRAREAKQKAEWDALSEEEKKRRMERYDAGFRERLSFPEKLDKTEDNLLKYCRYYNGDEHCPDDVHPMFWSIERHWVKAKMKNPKLKDEDWYVMKEYIEDGFEDFSKDDDTPIVIKAMLYEWNQKLSGFNRENTIKRFPQLYADYKNGGN